MGTAVATGDCNSCHTQTGRARRRGGSRCRPDRRRRASIRASGVAGVVDVRSPRAGGAGRMTRGCPAGTCWLSHSVLGCPARRPGRHRCGSPRRVSCSITAARRAPSAALRSPSWRRKSATSSDAPRSPGPRRARCGACSGPRAVVSLPAYSSWTAARVRCSACASSPVPVPAARSSAARWHSPSPWRSIRSLPLGALRPRRRSPPRLPCLRRRPPRLRPRPRRAGARVAFVRPRGHRGLRGRRRRRGGERGAADRTSGAASPGARRRAALEGRPRPAGARAGLRRGHPPADAGTPPVDAGVGAPDAGHPLDAGPPGATDAGVALRPDAGTEGPATEAGVPVLAAVPAPPKTGWRPVVGVEALARPVSSPGSRGAFSSTRASPRAPPRWSSRAAGSPARPRPSAPARSPPRW